MQSLSFGPPYTYIYIYKYMYVYIYIYIYVHTFMCILADVILYC